MFMKNRRVHKFDKDGDVRGKLYSLLENEYGKVVYSYTCHLKEHHTLSKKANWGMTITLALSTIISALSVLLKFNILSQDHLIWLIVIFSVFSTGCTAFLQVKNYAGKASRHENAQNELWVVRERYLTLLAEFSLLETKVIMSLHNELQRETAIIYKLSPLTGSDSYRKAKNALKNDEEQFFSRAEINLILPESLRK